jgi:hypothetical protein
MDSSLASVQSAFPTRMCIQSSDAARQSVQTRLRKKKKTLIVASEIRGPNLKAQMLRFYLVAHTSHASKYINTRKHARCLNSEL